MARLLLALATAICLAAGAARAAATAERHMVAAAHPLAAEAGRDMLRRGGGAVDAAIAAQMVLTLVEPQSSGIGGGAFLMYYDRARGRVEAYDGRETAPAGIRPDVFLDARGAPLPFMRAVVGGQSVGVPGVLRMLALAHRRHGRLPWAELFAPAIRLAEEGFAVTPRLHRMLAEEAHLKDDPRARAYFYDASGAAWPPGHRLANPALAATLRTIAREGADAFYAGPIARDIVAAVAARGGALGEADLRGYEAKRRVPLCRPYRAFRVCGMPPPTSGGVATLQILGMLERFDLPSLAPGSVEAVHLISEASRLAFADRGRYLADADFVPVPTDGLLDGTYLRERAGLISPSSSLGEAAPGVPAVRHGMRRGDGRSAERPSTSHLSIVDDAGNAVAMTTSIENAFGARIMVRGFLLNNQLTDFSFRSAVDGRPVANRVEPGKRPRSSMSPTLVLHDDGRLYVAVGSPGGSRIIGYVVETLVAVLDWGLDMQAAIDLPRHVNRNGATELEAGTPLADIADDLRALGHAVKVVPLTSGLHGIRATGAGLEGGADPRREGVALGD